MRTQRDFRNNFVSGEIAPEYLQRTGGELTKTGLKTALNTFITQAGTLTRRPGSWNVTDFPETGTTALRQRIQLFDTLVGTFHFMSMRPGILDILSLDGTLQASLPAPWDFSNLHSVTIVNNENALIFVHEDFFPQQLSYDAVTDAWSIGDLQWRTEPSGRTYPPFTRFDADGATVALGSYIGNTTATFSLPILEAGHVGVNFLYGFGAQFRIVSVTSPTQAQVEIIDRIYPTVVLSIDNTNAFRVGDVVQTDTTQVRGVVASVGAGTVTVGLISGYTLPIDPGPPPTDPDEPLPETEPLIGPNGSEEITAVVVAPTPAAIPIWFEELISDVRGFPNAGAIHRNRLVLSGFPQQPNLFTASAVNTLNDFDVGDGDDGDAINVRIGGDPNMKVRAVTSMEQLFINTDRGTFYVDEGGNRLFTPQLINFNFITPDRIGEIPPVVTKNGVAFIDDKSRIQLASMTGTTRAAWSIREITELGYHLINDARQIIYSTGIAGRPEEVLIVLNDDGTAASFNYDAESQQGGWVPWKRGRSDNYLSFAAWQGEIYCVGQTQLTENVSRETLERMDFAAVIDNQKFVASVPGTEDGIVCHLLRERHVIKSTRTTGFVGVENDIFGFDFPVIIQPAPNVVGQAGRQRKRASLVWFDVIDTGTYRCDDRILSGYGFAPRMSEIAPVNDREDRTSQLGSSYDSVITVSQNEGEGAPLHIRSITLRMKAT